MERGSVRYERMEEGENSTGHCNWWKQSSCMCHIPLRRATFLPTHSVFQVFARNKSAPGYVSRTMKSNMNKKDYQGLQIQKIENRNEKQQRKQIRFAFTIIAVTIAIIDGASFVIAKR